MASSFVFAAIIPELPHVIQQAYHDTPPLRSERVGVDIPGPIGPKDSLRPRIYTDSRPPGGVPLSLSGAEIIPQAIDAATRRLEAASPKDLDKWVAELERITGKKPDSWVENQGWRTEFVSQVRVAFNGLKWNAKAADILFKRAQTMPPSEARAWREAFETLLNQQIEPVCRVPLVLIPLDALYEGQKYSAGRAKKYRAHMKQLTTDDVSLWKDKLDDYGGTRLDAAMNIILLDDYFNKQEFQRDKFKAAIGARKK
jgi:hypothetical protein